MPAHLVNWFWRRVILDEICKNYAFFEILEIQNQISQQVLTNCWPKYEKSIQNKLLIIWIFYFICISPKLKKIFEGPDPPPKKGPFLGGVRTIDAKDFGYVSGRLWMWVTKMCETSLPRCKNIEIGIQYELLEMCSLKFSLEPHTHTHTTSVHQGNPSNVLELTIPSCISSLEFWKASF